MESSTKAELQISKLMTDLTSKKLDSSYKGTTQEFILEWLEKIREFENLIPLEAHFPNPFKKSMMENALQNLICLEMLRTMNSLRLQNEEDNYLMRNTSM